MNRTRRGQAATLGAILLLALFVRSYRIEPPGLSSDEAFSWRLTQYSPSEIVRRTGQDVHPPLYYLILKGWVTAAGTSPLALRSLSLLLGLLAVIGVFAAVREHERLCADDGGPAHPAGAAVLAAVLAALHETQVSPGRTARMYGLGLLLTTASACLLLRAVGARRRATGWWIAYGVVAAAFLYTHYYAGFTLLAQGLWVLGRAWRRRHSARAEAERALRGLALAAAVALLAFAPWLPVLRSQTRSVWQDYWIAEVTPAGVEDALAEWSVGPADLDAPWFALSVVALATAWALWRGERRGAFFAAQAVLPWIAGLALSLGDRSVFLARYMLFAHVGLLGVWATAASRVRKPWERGALAAVLVALAGYGSQHVARRYPVSAPAEALAARALARQAEIGDTVLVDSAYRLNRLLYYASRSGVAGVAFHCVLSRVAVGHGHVPHLSSLEPSDVVWLDEIGALPGRRFWWGSISGHPWKDVPANFKTVVVRTFVGGGGTRYTLTRYRRED